jgi:hypothetical protein
MVLSSILTDFFAILPRDTCAVYALKQQYRAIQQRENELVIPWVAASWTASLFTGFEEQSEKLVLHLELGERTVPGCLVQIPFNYANWVIRRSRWILAVPFPQAVPFSETPGRPISHIMVLSSRLGLGRVPPNDD